MLSTKTHQTIRHSQSTSAPCSQAGVVPTHMSFYMADQNNVCSILCYLRSNGQFFDTYLCIHIVSDSLRLRNVCVCVCVCILYTYHHHCFSRAGLAGSERLVATSIAGWLCWQLLHGHSISFRRKEDLLICVYSNETR